MGAQPPLLCRGFNRVEMENQPNTQHREQDTEMRAALQQLGTDQAVIASAVVAFEAACKDLAAGVRRRHNE